VVRDDGRIYDLLRKNALYCFVERNSGYEFPYGFRTKDDAMGRIQDIISDYKSGKLGKYSESAPK
jgi:hypothetical protein